ncbi:MAG TPA: hypothetical protein VJA26_12900 [Gammaproteobacteria bacterium]|nr:hypothetical protein [Gammaproteobacteria bacterium]
MKKKRADGWKATHSGTRVHYFSKWVDELDKSACELVYDYEQLQPIPADELRPQDYCKKCLRKHPEGI